MKTKFSTHWKKSKQPRKQKKYRYNAPLHTKRKFLSTNLSKELQKQFGRRSFPVRKGDEVEIMKGEFKKKIGKVTRINVKETKVYVDGMARKKVDGTDIHVPIDPSNLKIVKFDLDDEKRLKILKKKPKEEKHVKTSKKATSSNVLESSKKGK